MHVTFLVASLCITNTVNIIIQHFQSIQTVHVSTKLQCFRSKNSQQEVRFYSEMNPPQCLVYTSFNQCWAYLCSSTWLHLLSLSWALGLGENTSTSWVAFSHKQPQWCVWNCFDVLSFVTRKYCMSQVSSFIFTCKYSPYRCIVLCTVSEMFSIVYSKYIVFI